TVVPSGKPGLSLTVKSTAPSPSGDVTFGGRKPSSGSSGNWCVAGSSVVSFQVTTPVPAFSLASMPTRMFLPGRRSTSVLYVFSPGGTGTNVEPNVIGPRLNVARSYLAVSSSSVTVTVKASPVAVAWFSNDTVYGSGARPSMNPPGPPGPTLS